MSKLYIKDSRTGQIRTPDWYLPPQMLSVIDNNQTKFLLHQVTQMEAQFAEYITQGISYPEMVRTVGIESGFDYVGYQQKLKTGQAEFLSRNATDFPKISVGQQPLISPVIPIGMAYTINYFEQQTSNRFGMRLENDNVMDCAQYIDQKLDEAFHFGGRNPDNLEIKGFFDYFNGGADAQVNAGTSIHKVTLTTGVAGNTWALKTGAEIMRDVGLLIADVWVNSKKAKRAKVLAMGLNDWQELQSKTLLTEEGTVALLMPRLQAAHPDVKFVVDPYLDRINFSGTANETWDGQAGSSAIVAYDDDVTNIQFRAEGREILRPYEYKGFTTTVNTFGLCAGVQIKNTFFAAYMKGTN